jgi:hypothetical protein
VWNKGQTCSVPRFLNLEDAKETVVLSALTCCGSAVSGRFQGDSRVFRAHLLGQRHGGALRLGDIQEIVVSLVLTCSCSVPGGVLEDGKEVSPFF